MNDELTGIRGQIDTTFQTMQRDLFASGTVAQIGVAALAVWQAIKAHADFQTGVCWPSLRRLEEWTGLTTKTVLRAIHTLEEAHLLRVDRSGRGNRYIARERLVVRVANIPVCTVVVDYVPAKLKDTLPEIKAVVGSEPGARLAAEEMARIDIFPGPGFHWDATNQRLTQDVPRHEIEPVHDGPFTERIARIREGKTPVDKSDGSLE